MKKNELFVMWVNVTPYVRQYLKDNFSVSNPTYPDLVDIRKDSQLNALFTPRLEKRSVRRDRDLDKHARNKRRCCRMPFLISRDQFFRYGWAFTLTDERAFNLALETRCKTLLLTYLSSIYMIYGNLATCIQKFYRKFNFNDDIWPTDSIRKLWFRERNLPKITIIGEFEAKITDFVLGKLSENGTINKKGLENYESN